MNAQFTDAISDAPGISDMTLGQSIEARGDQRSGTVIAQAQSPLSKRVRLPELEYLSFINDQSLSVHRNHISLTRLRYAHHNLM